MGDPLQQHRHYIGLLLRAQRLVLSDVVPLTQTATTAGCGGVLSDKHRVAAHRRLLAIIFRLRRRQPLCHKLSGWRNTGSPLLLA